MKTNNFCQVLKQAIANQLARQRDPLSRQALEGAHLFLDRVEASFPPGTPLEEIPEREFESLLAILETLRCLGISIEGYNKPPADDAVIRVRSLFLFLPTNPSEEGEP